MDYVIRTSRKKPLRLLIFTLILSIAVFIICDSVENHTKTTTAKQVLPLPAQTIKQVLKQTQQNISQTITVQHGDTLASIFHRAQLPSTLWITVLKSRQISLYLDHLQAGSIITITTTPNHELVTLEYPIDVEKTLSVQQQNQKYVSTIIQKPTTKTVEFKSSIVHHSLIQAEKATGLPTSLQHQLDKMLSSGAAHDIHPGDHINVLYHEYFVGDHKDHPGNIVAAEITNGKKDYRIVRYTAPNHETGYYTANGDGTKPLFLKAPLHYKRIGSTFSYHRMDPVIHKIHPHLGVDFDAPKGTPVKAIGNGIVVFCNQMHGYGNVVMIRYNHTYKSLYAHLEKFATHMHTNEVVKKGQVVGYVGSTGWATGPHLHFSLYKNGVAINPLTAHFPNSSPVPARYRHAFLYQENRWFSEMALFKAAVKTPSAPHGKLQPHKSTPLHATHHIKHKKFARSHKHKLYAAHHHKHKRFAHKHAKIQVAYRHKIKHKKLIA